MKTKETHFPRVAKVCRSPDKSNRGIAPVRPTRTRGVALIIVLAFIALATVLVVAFMSSVVSSGIGENAAASETSAAQMASSAVQLVEGTITTATEPAADTTFAWACQPGMIRTYGTGSAASADPLAYYKLYSSDNMVINGKVACNQFTDSSQPASLYNEVPQYWDKSPALYTDLNAPLISSASTPIFPILDPRAADLGVEGFGISSSASTLDGTVLPSTQSPNSDPSKFTQDSGARMPMPVRWMYVLRDGTMTVPDGPVPPNATGSTTATWSASLSAAAIPTAANPIVGRVAFWTDDEDAKINVNTAAEGTYADTPIANTGVSPSTFVYPQNAPIGDVLLATNQGAQYEYQRYPGHPATTCLSPVFGVALNNLNTSTPAAFRASLVKAITDTIPRITDNSAATPTSGISSMGGTQDPGAGVVAGSTPTPLVTDKDRLYASLDEFQFLAPTSASSSRTAQSLGTAQTEQNLVDTCRFFLTAHSKAPELNLFGLPRVAMWPAWDDANVGKRTVFDQEIIHCATIAAGTSDAHRMSFTRLNPTSATTDFNIARNQQVYGYLQTLMGRGVPGFGGNFVSKYTSTDASQILAEIFDYIRCTNLADQSNGTAANSYTPSIPPGGTNLNVAVGQVVPSQTSSNRGIGRIATIAELGIVLVKIDDRATISSAEGTQVQLDPAPAPTVLNRAKSLSYSGDSSGTIDPSKQTLMEWVLIPKFFSPMAGYAGLGNDFRVRFAVSNLKIGDATATPINKTLGTLADEFDTGRLPNGGRAGVIGGLMGLTFPILGSGSQGTSSIPTGLVVVNGTNSLNGSYNGGTIQVSGDVDAYIYAPNGSAATGGAPIQTLHFEFPSTAQNVPIPTLHYWQNTDTTGTFRKTNSWSVTLTKTAGVTTGQVTFNYDPVNTDKGGSFSGRRWDGSQRHFLGEVGSSQPGRDTVRSLVATGKLGGAPLNGDLRLIAASQTVPKEAWALAQKNVSSGSSAIAGGADATPTDYQVSNLRDSNYEAYATAANGSTFPLASGLNFGNQRGPEVPPGIASVKMGNPIDGMVPGDWDNGPGVAPDGPYVNKPNEGESLTTSGYTSSNINSIPYIGPNENTSSYGAAASVYFSPNLQISSPVMFGSLPVGLDHPWRTLLFRPASLPGYESSYTHPGGSDPTIRDHLLLDLFWMPIVEPYGISEPFATSGKINLNTQIAPFTYITRTTGLRGVLKSVMLTGLNPSQIANSGGGKLIGGYKNPYGTATGASTNDKATDRYPLDLDQTLSQITVTPVNSTPPADTTNLYPEFARKTHTAALPNFFVSASQICDLPLIPQGSTPSSLATFWQNNILTGDNSLERPYSLIYPRVTTKSNIFTVHVLAQSLKKIATDPSQNRWNEGKDLVTSEYRGAYTIEKYFDPNSDDITTDAAGTVQSPATQDGSISNTAAVRNTKWRLLSVKRFGQ